MNRIGRRSSGAGLSPGTRPRNACARTSRGSSRENKRLGAHDGAVCAMSGSAHYWPSRRSGARCSADSESGCVVQGPIIARRRRGIATSRESTTTGRRPTPASSHHQTSPRAGSAVTTRRQPFGTRRGHPFVVRVDWDAVVHDEQVLLIGLPMAHGHRFARPKHERLTPSCSSCRSPSKSSATTQTSPRPST
jgi:hypothetical protein